MAEALAHLLGADDLSATFMAPGDLAWLADTSVLQVSMCTTFARTPPAICCHPLVAHVLH